MAAVIDLRDARRSDVEWDAVVREVLDAPDLGRVDLTGARIDAEHLAAILAAAPPGCVIARQVDRRGEPLGPSAAGAAFPRLLEDLAELADRLGDDALGDALFEAADPPQLLGELPRLVAAAAPAPAIAAFLRELEAGLGGDGWVDLVPALAGSIRCWRGDGGDAPVWDRDVADELRQLG
jgi:hypothetical protein